MLWIYINYIIFFFVHLFTNIEGQMTPVTTGYETIFMKNGFSKVSNHILSIMIYSLN